MDLRSPTKYRRLLLPNCLMLPPAIVGHSEGPPAPQQASLARALVDAVSWMDENRRAVATSSLAAVAGGERLCISAAMPGGNLRILHVNDAAPCPGSLALLMYLEGVPGWRRHTSTAALCRYGLEAPAVQAAARRRGHAAPLARSC